MGGERASGAAAEDDAGGRGVEIGEKRFDLGQSGAGERFSRLRAQMQRFRRRPFCEDNLMTIKKKMPLFHGLVGGLRADTFERLQMVCRHQYLARTPKFSRQRGAQQQPMLL